MMLRPVSDLQLDSPKLDLTLCCWGVCYGLLFLGFGASWAVIGPSLNELVYYTNSSLDSWSWVLFFRALGYVIGAVIGERFFVRYPCSAIVIVAVVCESTCLVIVPMVQHLWPVAGIFMALGLAFGLMDTVGHSQLLSIQGDQAFDRGPFPETLSDFHDSSYSLGRKVLPYIQTLHVAFGIGAVVISLLSVPYANTAAAQVHSASLWADLNNNNTQTLVRPHIVNHTLKLVSNSINHLPFNQTLWHPGLTEEEMNKLIILHVKHEIADMKQTHGAKHRRSQLNNTFISGHRLAHIEVLEPFKILASDYDKKSSAKINAMITGQHKEKNKEKDTMLSKTLAEKTKEKDINSTTSVSTNHTTSKKLTAKNVSVKQKLLTEDISNLEKISEIGIANNTLSRPASVKLSLTTTGHQINGSNINMTEVSLSNTTFSNGTTERHVTHEGVVHPTFSNGTSGDVASFLYDENMMQFLEKREQELYLSNENINDGKHLRLHWIFWSIVIIQIPIFLGFIILSLCSHNSPRHDLVLLSSAECHNADENCMELHQEDNSAESDSCQRTSLVLLLNIFHFIYSGVETSFPVLLCMYCTQSPVKVDSQAAVYMTAVYWMFYTLGKIGLNPLLSTFGHNIILAANFPMLLLSLVLMTCVYWSETILWCTTCSTGFCLSVIFPTLLLMVTSQHQLTRAECRSLLFGGGLGDMVIPAALLQMMARFNMLILGVVLTITSLVLGFLYICIYCLEVSARNNGTIRILGLGHGVLFTTRGLLHIDSLHVSQHKTSTLVAYRRVDSDESDDECQIIVNTAGVPVQINSSVQLSGVYETE